VQVVLALSKLVPDDVLPVPKEGRDLVDPEITLMLRSIGASRGIKKLMA